MQFQTGCLPAGPFDQAIDALGDIPEQLSAIGPVEAGDGIDVERNDVGPLHVLRVVIKARARASPLPVVVGDALGPG